MTNVLWDWSRRLLYACHLRGILTRSVPFTLYCGLLWTPVIAQTIPALPPAISSHAAEFGLPQIRTYLPEDYKAHRQNWALLQAPSGLIYAGNTEGLLEFDGLRWRLIPMPNGSMVRSLDADKTSGRIYVGAANELGYLAPDAVGLLQYQSLVSQLPAAQRQFGDVWHTHATPEGVFFVTGKRLFRFDAAGVQSWPAQQGFVHSGWLNGRFYLRDEGVGLLQLKDDKLQRVADGARFATDRISVLLAWPQPDQLMMISRTLGFMRFDGKQFQHWPTDIDQQIKSELVYSALPLADGLLAVGTMLGGLYLLDQDGRLAGSINRKLGLPDNAIYSQLQDHEGGLWLGTNAGIARLQFASPLRQFDQRHGLDGTVSALQRFRGRLYVGTSQGLYWLEPGVTPRFVAVPGLANVVWQLLVIDDQLLATSAKGVHRVLPEGAELIYADDNAFKLHWINGQTPTLLTTSPQGITQLHPAGKQWRVGDKLVGIKGDIYSVLPEGNATLWLSTRNDGLIRLYYPSGQLLQGPAEISYLGLAEGLTDLRNGKLLLLNGQMRFLSAAVLYQFDPPSQKLRADLQFQQLFMDTDRLVQLLDSPQGVWLELYDTTLRQNRFGLVTPDASGHYHWQHQTYTGSVSMSVLFAESLDRFWFGSTVLQQFQPSLITPAATFALKLRQISTGDGNVVWQDAGGEPAALLTLSHQQNKLRFEFAALSYQGANEYAVWLEGVDSGWSDWRKEAFIDYNSLWEGRYLLKVKARNSAGAEALMRPLQLQINPPWFRSPLMYLSYLLALLLLINRWYRWRTKRLCQEALALEHMVDKRTQQLSEAKTQVEHTVEELQQTLSSLKSTQRQLVRSEKMAALGQLVAGVAHEVNTPLGVALTGSSFLRESTEALAGTLNAGQLRKQDLDSFLGSALESSQLIERNLQRAADLISNFKQVSVDRSSGERRQFQLRGFLLEVEQSLATLWRNRAVQFFVECPIDIQLDSYPGALSQVITILAQNSLLHAFSAEDGGEMRLSVRVLDPQNVEIVFADNGSGIAAEHLEKVFEPFFTTKRAQGGTGLGLHILFNLVSERLGGTVAVESGKTVDVQEQSGCRFILILPRVAPQPAGQA